MTDVRITEKHLREHTTWLRSLAFSLVRDENQADDLVQETWLRVHRTPLRSEGSIKAFLMRVLKNNWKQSLRETSRRQARETEAFHRQTDPGTDRELAIQGRLIAAMRELSDEQKEVLHLRHYHGLSPKEIAARLGIDASTVRTRLHRGHKNLRERLDRGHGGRGAWCALLSPLLKRPITKGVLTSTMTGGAIVMSIKAKTALVAVVMLLICVPATMELFQVGEKSLDVDSSFDATSPEESSAPRRARMPLVQSGGTKKIQGNGASEQEHSRPQQVAEKESLRIRLVTPDGSKGHAASLRVTLFEKNGERKRLRAESTVGQWTTIDLTELPKASELVEWEVLATCSGFLPISKRLTVEEVDESKGTLTAEILLQTAFAITGRLIGTDGEPVPGVTVSAHRTIHDEDPGEVETDALGRFYLQTDEDRDWRLAFISEPYLPKTLVSRATAGKATDLGDIFLLQGGELSGRVLVNGEASGTARVEVQRIETKAVGALSWGNIKTTAFDEAGIHTQTAKTETDADGGWRIKGLEDGTYLILLTHLYDVSFPGAPQLVGGVTADEIKSEEPAMRALAVRRATALLPNQDFDLKSGSLDFEVLSAGQPLSGFLLEGPGFRRSRCPSQFTVSTLVPSTMHLTIDAEDHTPFAADFSFSSSASMERHTINLTPLRPEDALGSLIISVRDADNEPIEKVSFGLLPVDAANGQFSAEKNMPPHTFNKTSKTGEFLIKDIPFGIYDLVIRAGSDFYQSRTFHREVVRRLEIKKGETTSAAVVLKRAGRLRIEASNEAGTRLAPYCEILNSAGRKLDVSYSNLLSNGSQTSDQVLSGRSPVDVQPALPPGRYTIKISLKGHETLSKTIDIIAGKRLDLSLTF